MFQGCVRGTRQRVATSSLDDFWCACVRVCVYWVCFGKHQPRTDGYYESEAFLLIYVRFIHFVCDHVVNEFLLLYLYNKSFISEQQLTIGGLFDYVYCVYITLGSRFHSGRRELKYGISDTGCKTHKRTWSSDCYREGSIQVNPWP